MQALISDLLDLARLDEQRREDLLHSVDLWAACEHAIERVNGQDVAVTLAGGPASPIVGVESQIERAVFNLVDNAVAHADQHVLITLVESATAIAVRVEDDGPGIPPEDRVRVLDRFVRLDESRQRRTGSSGLGLSLRCAAGPSTAPRTATPSHSRMRSGSSQRGNVGSTLARVRRLAADAAVTVRADAGFFSYEMIAAIGAHNACYSITIPQNAKVKAAAAAIDDAGAHRLHPRRRPGGSPSRPAAAATSCAAATPSPPSCAWSYAAAACSAPAMAQLATASSPATFRQHRPLDRPRAHPPRAPTHRRGHHPRGPPHYRAATARH